MAACLASKRQHVVEKSDAGRDLRAPAAVEFEFQLDLGFGRLAMNLGGACHAFKNTTKNPRRAGRLRAA